MHLMRREREEEFVLKLSENMIQEGKEMEQAGKQ